VRTPGFVPPQAATNQPNVTPPVEPPLPFELDPNNEYDVQFEKTYRGLANNPKVQAQVLADYSKDKFNMNEGQTKAAGFADRTLMNEPILEDPKVVKELGSRWERIKAGIPIIGNTLVSNDFQAGEQAQRDFINSILRRESGAVISDSEFDNARKQYFPQPGDSPATLEQKRLNRETAISGLQRSAGPAYKKPYLPPKLAKEKADFEAKKAAKAGSKSKVVNWSDL